MALTIAEQVDAIERTVKAVMHDDFRLVLEAAARDQALSVVWDVVERQLAERGLPPRKKPRPVYREDRSPRSLYDLHLDFVAAAAALEDLVTDPAFVVNAGPLASATAELYGRFVQLAAQTDPSR